jgi:hypothetical protein
MKHRMTVTCAIHPYLEPVLGRLRVSHQRASQLAG